jgi:hypothetical protein
MGLPAEADGYLAVKGGGFIHRLPGGENEFNRAHPTGIQGQSSI